MNRITQEVYLWIVISIGCVLLGYLAVDFYELSLKDCHYAWCVEAAGE